MQQLALLHVVMAPPSSKIEPTLLHRALSFLWELLNDLDLVSRLFDDPRIVDLGKHGINILVDAPEIVEIHLLLVNGLVNSKFSERREALPAVVLRRRGSELDRVLPFDIDFV